MWKFLIRIFKSAIENWLISLITALGVAIGGWLLWLYREYLKDWLLSIRYVEMPGWAWVAIILVISMIPAFCVFGIMRWQTCKKRRVFTNEIDIKTKLRQWFQQRYCGDWIDPISRDTVDFSVLDEKLGLAPGSAKRHLESVVNEFDWRTMNEGPNMVEIRSI